jgi:hypothetical protein
MPAEGVIIIILDKFREGKPLVNVVTTAFESDFLFSGI